MCLRPMTRGPLSQRPPCQSSTPGPQAINPRHRTTPTTHGTYTGKSAEENLQCRHLILELNAWAAQAYKKTARLIASQFPGHRCVHRTLTSHLNVALQHATCNMLRKQHASGSLICLAYYFDLLWVFVQTGTGRCPVDWCRN